MDCTGVTTYHSSPERENPHLASRGVSRNRIVYQVTSGVDPIGKKSQPSETLTRRKRKCTQSSFNEPVSSTKRGRFPIAKGAGEYQKQLIEAAKVGNLALIKSLIKQGAGINFIGRQSPLWVAARCGHPDVIDYLVRQGADIDANAAGCGMPIWAAARYGHRGTVHFLYAKGSDINARASGRSSTLYAAAISGNLTVVKYLVANGADINAKATGSDTPLWAAARCGNLDVVKYLVETKGADINAKATGTGTPLFVAAKNGNLDVVEYLIAKSADIKLMLRPQASQERVGSERVRKSGVRS